MTRTNKIEPALILNAVAREYSLGDGKALLYNMRTGQIVEAREVAVWALRQAGLKNKDIADVLGFTKNHISRIVKNITDKIQTTPDFKSRLDRIQDKINLYF